MYMAKAMKKKLVKVKTKKDSVYCKGTYIHIFCRNGAHLFLGSLRTSYKPLWGSSNEKETAERKTESRNGGRRESDGGDASSGHICPFTLFRFCCRNKASHLLYFLSMKDEAM